MRFWFFLIFALTLTQLAAAELAVPSRDCKCEEAAEDLLAGPNQLNFGAFSGRCMDACRYRKSVPLAPFKKNADSVLLSNYLHEGKYWTAQIPRQGLKKVQVAFEEFMPQVFHVFLIFEFLDKSSVYLTPQVGARAGQTVRISNLVVSPEGIPPKAGKYNLVDAYMERYPIGIRTMSRQQVIRWSVEKQKHKVEVFDLKLSSVQAKALLDSALESLTSKSFKVRYGLLTNNCATSVLDYIDAVIKPEAERFPLYYSWLYPLERALSIAGPFGTRNIMLSRNLIETDSGRLLEN
jgi:hypothetical protein